jgi:hypothetical protein
MGAPEACPHCGAVRGGVPEPRQPLEALYDEVARIREIAERQQAERETIARLTREVQMLRETVALLRGTTHRAAAARPQRLRSPAA